jgi:hypothetical protein
VGNPSTQTTVTEGDGLKARIYHAHAICTYGRPTEQSEQALIRQSFPEYEIVDPGLAEENEEKLLGGMEYCKKLVESCDALAFSRIQGKVTAGVGVEVKHALALGKPVYELTDSGVRQVFEPPTYVSREETRKLYVEWMIENL